VKSIIDEGVPRDLVKQLGLIGCKVEPFPNEWKGTKNGSLLDLLERSGFDCLVTCDKNMRWQQPIAHRDIAVVVLPVQKLIELIPMVAAIADAIGNARRGEVHSFDG
jgi:hypothetical protein